MPKGFERPVQQVVRILADGRPVVMAVPVGPPKGDGGGGVPPPQNAVPWPKAG